MQLVELPPHLKNHPYLSETYGTVQWSVKGVFTNYMGWYSGRPYDLEPLSQKEEATEFMKFTGNDSNHVYNEAVHAFNQDKWKWSMRLCDYLIETENVLTQEAKRLKAQCLEKLSDGQSSFGGRNWYLTSAMELNEDLVVKPTQAQKTQRIRSTSLSDLFIMMTTMLDAEKTIFVIEEAHFEFVDIDKYFILKVSMLLGQKNKIMCVNEMLRLCISN